MKKVFACAAVIIALAACADGAPAPAFEDFPDSPPEISNYVTASEDYTPADEEYVPPDEDFVPPEGAISTHEQLAEILAGDNSAGTEIALANDILLEDGQTYDFTGITFDVTGGIMLVPENSLVTIIGFEHICPYGTVRSDWGRYALGLYVQGVASSSWIYRPDLTLEETGTPDQVRWWDIYHGSPHWCPFNAHGMNSPPVPVAAYDIFVAAIEARRRGGLRDVAGNSVDNSITVRFTNDITLQSGRTYNLYDVHFITDGGELIIPEGAIIVEIPHEPLSETE